MNTKSKVILSFITIFLLGGISGYLVRDSFVVKDQISYNEQHRKNNERNDRNPETEQERRQHREQMRERAQNRLISYLDITGEQNEEFFNLLESYHTEIRDSIRTIRAGENQFIREHYHEFKKELEGVLDQNQLNKLDRFFHPDSVRHNRMNQNYRN